MKIQDLIKNVVDDRLKQYFSDSDADSLFGVFDVVAKDLSVDFDEPANDVWVVVKVEKRFFKITGFADSYGGVDWILNDIKEVKPIIKTVTTYEVGE